MSAVTSIGDELKEMLARVHAKIRPEDMELAEQAIADYAALAVRRLTGEDVNQALADAELTLRNIRVGGAATLSGEVVSVIVHWMSRALSALMPRPA